MSLEASILREKDRLPTFDLEYRYDDPEDPAEVTILSADDRTVTVEWISADARYAIPLEHVA